MKFNSEAGVDEKARLFAAGIFLCTCIYIYTAVHVLKIKSEKKNAVKAHCKAENRSLEESPKKEMIRERKGKRKKE